MDELSDKAQEGILTPAERRDLDEYVRVDHEPAVLQTKARLSLKRTTPSR